MAENMLQGMGEPVLPAVPPCPGGQTYMVRSGDTMFQIARRFNISLDSLIAANPQITDPNMIFPGQVICVPGAEAPPSMACPGGTIYTVQRGDTLFAIARRNGLSLEALRAANPQIVNPDMIFPGQAVCIPGAMPPAACPEGTLYTIMPGDTMFEIAARAGISLQTLVAANPQIADPNRIFPGQIICVPGAVTPPAPVVISPVVSPVVSPAVPPMMPPAPPEAPMMEPMEPVEPMEPMEPMEPEKPMRPMRPPMHMPAPCPPCPPCPRPVCPCPGGQTYIVRPGDTMFQIARRFNIPLDSLIAANPQITDPNTIFPGQAICVPSAAAPPAPVVIPPVVSPIESPKEPPKAKPAPCPTRPVMPAFPCPFMRPSMPCPVSPIPVEPAKKRRRRRFCCFC